MKQKLLTKKQLQTFVKKFPNWELKRGDKDLVREISFSQYVDGLVLIARICVHAELLKHHPEITYKYSTMRIKLTTHEAKGLTKLDTALAERIEKLCGK
ncbi:4a-hydroxytetrahydrobiopterin dehydratase [Candidatus Nomurabacteria bacterium]|nr:4a-hydroxytetrahydrobiopterin dehydratase [Candidatus Nomurabacteria bacterium]